MSKIARRYASIILLLGVMFFLVLFGNILRQQVKNNSKLSPLQSKPQSSSFSPIVLTDNTLPKAKFLLSEWHKIKSGGKPFERNSEVCALVRKSINELLCGEDLIALIESLTIDDDTIDDLFDSEIKQLLSQGTGLRHHTAIASIQDNHSKYRSRWSYFAGLGCTGADLDAFLKVLFYPEDQELAKLGSLVRSCESDAVAGIKALIAAEDHGDTGVPSKLILKDAINAAVDVAAFPAIEESIRTASKLNKEMVNDLRDHLLDRWVVSNPQSLAAHFNKYPDEITGDDAARIVVRTSRISPEKAFELAQQLDSPKHFDRAVLAVLPYVHVKYPKESMELIQQLSLPKDRAFAAKMVTGGLEDDINRE